MIVGEGFPVKVSTKLEDRGEVLQLPLIKVIGGCVVLAFWRISVSRTWKKVKAFPLKGH
jgi:hypothetical protein